MKRILTAVILIPLVLVLVFLGPRWQWVFTLATAGVAALASWEFLGMAERSGVRPHRMVVLLAILLLFAGIFEWPDQSTAILGALSLGLLIFYTFSSPVELIMPDAVTSVFCLFYVGFTLISLPSLREQTNGPSLVAFLLCVVWAGDIAALYVGRTWGRHKLAPKLSPNKSWEGAAASVAGSLLAAGGLLALASRLEALNSVILSYPEDVWY